MKPPACKSLEFSSIFSLCNNSACLDTGEHGYICSGIKGAYILMMKKTISMRIFFIFYCGDYTGLYILIIVYCGMYDLVNTTSTELHPSLINS